MKGVKICEGEFEGVVEFPTKEQFDAYAAGFSSGAGQYGAGDAGVYTREDLEDWKDQVSRDPGSKYYTKRIAIVEKHLPETPQTK